MVPAAQASRVLHVGDSMAPLVGNYLRSIFSSSGRQYFLETVISSSTLDWAEKGLLREAMYKYDPEVVLISLGSNELFDPKPERRGPAVAQKKLYCWNENGKKVCGDALPAEASDSARTEISAVAITTALYPIVSVGLAVALLGERLTLRQWIGAGLALVAVALLAPTT